MMPTLVVQKQALAVAEAEAIHAKIHQSGFDQGALFIPRVTPQLSATGAESLRYLVTMFDPRLVLISLGAGSTYILATAKDVDSRPVDLRPTTDDRPFFYNFDRGLPSPFPVCLGLIIASVVGLGILLALPRRRGAVGNGFITNLRASGTLKAHLSLFFGLGIAYMVVEIAIFQKLAIYISQPQMNLTILLFSLLLGGGIGSLLSTFLRRSPLWAAAVIAGAAAAFVPTLALVFPRVFALGLDPRLTAFALIFPLGILMGFPFPLAIRSLAEVGYESHTALMWGVNGATSVLGSALAMIVGISWGFSRALFLGAVTSNRGFVRGSWQDKDARGGSGTSYVTPPSRRSTPHLHTR
jgi:hypothetical protein